MLQVWALVELLHVQQGARSPDHNTLDLMVWRVIEKAVHKQKPKTKEELIDCCVEAWGNLSPTEI